MCFGRQALVSHNPCGSVYYNKVYKTGIYDNIGYITTDIELLTLQYNLHEMMPIPLCSDSLTAGSNNQNACPGDGSYGFSFSYKLPSAGEKSTSWLASGWAGSGIMRIYAEQDESMKIGECTFDLKTYVTPTADQGFFQAPSAAATVGIVLGGLAAIALVCLYCYCCAKKRKQKLADEEKETKTISPDDLSTFFKRLDEEAKSIAAASIAGARETLSVVHIPSRPAETSTVAAGEEGKKESQSVKTSVYESPKPPSNGRSVVSEMAL